MLKNIETWIGSFQRSDHCLHTIDRLWKQLTEEQIYQLLLKAISLDPMPYIPKLISRLKKVELDTLKSLKIELAGLKNSEVNACVKERLHVDEGKFSYKKPLDVIGFINDGRKAAQQALASNGATDNILRVIAMEYNKS